MGRLDGKVALITGAQQGIGRGMALAFAHDGADVGINYLDDPKAAARVAADVSSVKQIDEMVRQVVQTLGGLDVLVNNAGVYPRVAMLEMREEDWDLLLDVNLKGTFFCAQAAARAMVAAKRRGA